MKRKNSKGTIEAETIISKREELGAWLKKKREAKDISLYKLLHEGGLNLTQSKDIEGGRTSYTIDSLIRYCEITNIKNIPLKFMQL